MTAPPDIAGYCSQCGMPFASTSGPFCRHCGSRARWPEGAQPGSAYPVVPPAEVPAARHKLGHLRFLAVAGLGLAVLVAAGTTAAVLLQSPVNYCHFSCGIDLGPRLLSTDSYQSSEYGYRVEYYAQYFKPGTESPSGVELESRAGPLAVTASMGTGDKVALQSDINQLGSNTYQDLQQVSSTLPGAEIGGVVGAGEVYDANYVEAGSGHQFPVTVIVMAATEGDLTISVTAVGYRSLDNYSLLPYGLEEAQLFDFEPLNTIWPGQE